MFLIIFAKFSLGPARCSDEDFDEADEEQILLENYAVHSDFTVRGITYNDRRRSANSARRRWVI